MHDLPASLRVSSPFPFVGRGSELARLRALMPTEDGDGRRVVLVGGAPGSGKSRLAREFARETAADGALVLYGASDAVVNTPYGPFAQVLEHLARVIDPSELARRLAVPAGSSRGCGLTYRAGSVSSPRPSKADPDTERHRLHTALS